MGRNTSVSLGNYFENFVDTSVSEGRFKNASEVIRAGQRLLEEENNVIALKRSIEEGFESGFAKNFYSKKTPCETKSRQAEKWLGTFLPTRLLNDLSEIWDYTVDACSEAQADRYYYMLLDSCQELNWQTTKDEQAFSKAEEMNAIVLTKDKDFIGLLKKHKAPPKIIWLTCGNTSNKRLKEILSSTK